MNSTPVYTELFKKFTQAENTNSDAQCKLFFTLDLLCQGSFSCAEFLADEDDVEVPDSVNSKNYVDYEYHGKLLQLSVMKETSDAADQHFLYYCLSFPENPEFYVIEDIPVDLVPSFIPGKCKEDEAFIDNLFDSLTLIFGNFCHGVVKKNKVTPQEFSLVGIDPLLNDKTEQTPSSTKKRKKETTPATSPVKRKTRRSIYPFYEELRQMNSDLSRKPSPVSRLFAILHNLWISFGHTSSLKSEGWPGGVDYQNNVVAMYFKSKQQILLSEQTDLSEDTDASKQAENVGGANENTMPGSSTGSQGSQSGEGQGSQSGESQGSESGVKKSSKAATVSVIVMNVSIINNSEEYFVCFRSTVEPSRKCFRKLSKRLVPTFQVNDLELDCQKLENLTLWSRSIIQKFITRSASCLSSSVATNRNPSSRNSSTISV